MVGCVLTGILLVGAASAQTASGAAAQPRADAATAETRFDILEFVVEGDTALGAAAIERAVYPFLGPQRGAADADGARKALEQAYQQAGFLSVNVVLPPQRIDASGLVRLQVLQAPVDRLRVTGAQFTLPSRVRDALPSLAPGSVPNFEEMQEELSRLSRQSADREFTPIVAAGERPGTLAVEIKVQDRPPLHGSVELNNKQSPGTRAGRLEAGLQYDDLFQRSHGVSLNWVVSPRSPSQSNILSLGYHLPVGGEGDRLFLSYLHSSSNTPTPLGGATVARGDTWRLRWRDELRGLDGLSHALSWGLTLRRLRDANLDVAGASVPAPGLHYPTLHAGYELDLSSAAPDAGAASGSTRLQLDWTMSLSDLSRRMVDCAGVRLEQFACKRAAASPGFQVLGLQLAHREPLGKAWLGARIQAQFADRPLVPAEQVVYGGQDSVRGYQEGEQAGDLGAALRLDLTSPPWLAGDRLSLRGQLFHDRAVVRKLEPLPGERAQARLASVGAGLLVESAIGLRASLYWARILQAASAGRGGGSRWDLSIQQSF